MLKADGFDEAILGVGFRCGQKDILVYSIDKCIQILMKGDNMTLEEASEYLEFNSIGAWVGEETPIWVDEGGQHD